MGRQDKRNGTQGGDGQQNPTQVGVEKGRMANSRV